MRYFGQKALAILLFLKKKNVIDVFPGFSNLPFGGFFSQNLFFLIQLNCLKSRTSFCMQLSSLEQGPIDLSFIGSKVCWSTLLHCYLAYLKVFG